MPISLPVVASSALAMAGCGALSTWSTTAQMPSRADFQNISGCIFGIQNPCNQADRPCNRPGLLDSIRRFHRSTPPACRTRSLGLQGVGGINHTHPPPPRCTDSAGGFLKGSKPGFCRCTKPISLTTELGQSQPPLQICCRAQNTSTSSMCPAVENE